MQYRSAVEPEPEPEPVGAPTGRVAAGKPAADCLRVDVMT
jgi:hypothetical protein